MTQPPKYYLRDDPRTLYRVESGTGRVEMWTDNGWEPTAISPSELEGPGGDNYSRVNPIDVETMTGAPLQSSWLDQWWRRITSRLGKGRNEDARPPNPGI